MNSLTTFFRRTFIALVASVLIPLSGGLLAVASSTDAEAAVVSSISVRGNQRVDASTVGTYIIIKPGVSFGPAEIDESIKILYGTGLFSDVNIFQSGAVLVVVVAENPVIASVSFEGNKKVKSNILTQVVGSEAREVLTEARLQSDVSRIKAYYARSGRAGVQVDPSVTDIGNNRVTVVFFITEGDRTGIARIDFIGNQAFSKTRLRRIIQSRQTNFMSWLSKRDVFSDEKLAADQEALRRHYLKFGYADFQVLAAEGIFDADTGRYHVVFTIEEGPRYRFGEIQVDSSIPGVDSASLLSVVRSRSGKVFNANNVEKSVEELTIELARRGFVFAQVRPRGDRNYIDNIIDITYVIDEGPRAYVERIVIRGNSKTRDFVIRREFELSEGDAYNRVLIDKAERKLRNLDFFEFVNITTEPGSSPDRVIVVVSVADKSTGSISAAAGISTSDGLIAEVALEERNFLGRGQNLRLSIGGGITDRTYNLSFTDPYFLGNRMAFGVDAYRTTGAAGAIRPYAQESIGGGLRIGLPLNDETNLTFNYKIVQNVSSGAVAPATASFPNGTRLTSSMGYGLSYSTLDNRVDPREGFHFKLTQDFAGLGGTSAFIRTVADARYYRPLIPDGDIIGMLRATGGNIMGLGMPVSYFDNFHIGGETVRGFANYGIGPRETNT
ncbi:MAG: outer membrane protein assembly factor BamA, partial [Alphaproteobacteria bacterium]